MNYNTLELLTHDELIAAVIVAAKKKNKNLKKKDLKVHFRWGTPQDEIIATIDEVAE